MEIQNQKRDPYWDAVKGLGIFCVLLGHLVSYDTLCSSIIFNFHMPLFFFVAGFFFREQQTWSSLIERLFRNILIPWIFFWIIGAIVYSVRFGVCQLIETTYLLRLWHGSPPHIRFGF